MSETVFANAVLLTEAGAERGSLAVSDDGLIRAVDTGAAVPAGAVDCDGDFLAPGLIEMHTDNMEKHFQPRPKVTWPNGLAAALAHDAQMAAAGVTTVYDAICAGSHESKRDFRTEIYWSVLDAIRAGEAGGAFRIEHRIHIRCELTDPHLMEFVEPIAEDPHVALVSLMDHTPGQRQWRNIDHLRTFAVGSGQSAEDFEDDIRKRMEIGPIAVRENWGAVLGLFKGSGIPIASHDDTTEDHVAEAVASGVTISEFPTTMEAARAAKTAGLATVAGAPNVVRGGSHSGGVSVRDLAAASVLDGLSSDYVPASLLQAVGKISRDLDRPLHDVIGLVTWEIADMLGLSDRGRLAPGLRADTVRFRFVGETPVVRALYRAGERVL